MISIGICEFYSGMLVNGVKNANFSVQHQITYFNLKINNL